MYTVNQLGKKFNLARSTLLYYDKIGVLKPSTRSAANYRLYTENDVNTLQKIVTYREAGLSLESIAEILQIKASEPTVILEQRLRSINNELSQLRQQQQQIIKLLGCNADLKTAKVMDKQQWVNILRASGLDDDAMRRWHIEFERDLPQVHTDFFESLGIESDEVAAIKAWSKLG